MLGVACLAILPWTLRNYSVLDGLFPVSTAGWLDVRSGNTLAGDRWLHPDLDLFGLAHEFLRLRVRRFPVLEEGRLVGQVSRRDALRAALKLRRDLRRGDSGYPDYPEGRDPIRNYPRDR